jgi:hypothetical protein
MTSSRVIAFLSSLSKVQCYRVISAAGARRLYELISLNAMGSVCGRSAGWDEGQL